MAAARPPIQTLHHRHTNALRRRRLTRRLIRDPLDGDTIMLFRFSKLLLLSKVRLVFIPAVPSSQAMGANVWDVLRNRSFESSIATDVTQRQKQWNVDFFELSCRVLRDCLSWFPQFSFLWRSKRTAYKYFWRYLQLFDSQWLEIPTEIVTGVDWIWKWRH